MKDIGSWWQITVIHIVLCCRLAPPFFYAFEIKLVHGTFGVGIVEAREVYHQRILIVRQCNFIIQQTHVFILFIIEY